MDNGAAPIMLEPVKASINFTGRKIAQVNILDQDGKDSGRTLPATGGSFYLDSSQDKMIYYDFAFEQ